jgi:hypothetical protein
MKNAFPNFSEYMPTKQVYNLSRWMESMKNVYVRMHLGANKNEAVDVITADWNPIEKLDFINWMKYYESGDHKKYKRAQKATYYVNDDLNYFIPNPKQNIPSPIRSINEQITNAPQEAANAAAKQKNEEDKRQTIEDLRRKILGRLNSAEKLLSSQQGHMFAGGDFERLLSAIFELKKQIQIVNKVSVASLQTVVDLIVRQANILKKEGHSDASNFMVKLAQQVPGDMSLNLGDIPSGGSQPNGGGALGNNTPNVLQPLPEKSITEDSAVGQFIDNLEDSGITDTVDEEEVADKSKADDLNNVEIDNDVFMDQEIIPEGKDDLVVEAQAAPTPDAPSIKPKNKPDDLEVDEPTKNTSPGITPENVKQPPNIETPKTDFDAILDSAFANLTVQDVINKLEQVNNIFRTREIARQLAVCDLMLSRLGLAQFFPQLGESINKSLDSGQYALVRIDEILSKLRGSVKSKNIDLEGDNQKTPPGAQAIKSNLEQMDQKEKQRKEVKKQLQDQTDMEKATKPEGTVENPQGELAAQPIEVENPAPVAPAPKPAPAPAV